MSSILKVDTIQDQSGNNIINENADTITIGASGDTITIPSGATIDASGATISITYYYRSRYNRTTIRNFPNFRCIWGHDYGIPSGATIDLSNATQTGVGGTNTPAFFAYPSSTTTITASTATKVSGNTVAFDTDSCYDNTTNYRFTPTTAGKYFCFGAVSLGTVSGNFTAFNEMRINFYKNGSSIHRLIFDFQANQPRYGMIYIQNIINFNGSSDYLELFAAGFMNGAETPQIQGDNSVIPTYFGAYKLIGV
jgi:hypothetical protein